MGNSAKFQLHNSTSRLYQLVAEATEQPGDWKPPELLSLRTLSMAFKTDLELSKELGREPSDLEIAEELRRKLPDPQDIMR